MSFICYLKIIGKSVCLDVVFLVWEGLQIVDSFHNYKKSNLLNKPIMGITIITKNIPTTK